MSLTSRIRIADIVTLASRLSGVDEALIYSRSRVMQAVRVRMAVYLVAREHGYSTPAIGRVLAKDHSSVVHGSRKAAIFAEYDPDFDRFIRALRIQSLGATPFLIDAASPIYSPRRATPVKAPVKQPQPRPRNDFREKDNKDDAHRFHDGIAKGSADLAAAIRKARA